MRLRRSAWSDPNMHRTTTSSTQECGWKRGYGLGPGLSRGVRSKEFAETQLATAGLSWKRVVTLRSRGRAMRDKEGWVN
jgi:hypothetical protein